MTEQKEIRLQVNGVERTGRAEPRMTLVDFLRHRLDLTGTHVGCEHGVCGACTVLMDGRSVRACLVFAVQAEGHTIRTVEGLAPNESELHPIQEAFTEKHGLQCGFCTPGFLLTAYELLSEHGDPSDDEIRESLSGNLCRCTGYQNIIESVKHAAHKMQGTAS